MSRHSKPDSLPGVLDSRVCQPEVSLCPHESTKAWPHGEKEGAQPITPPGPFPYLPRTGAKEQGLSQAGTSG